MSCLSNTLNIALSMDNYLLLESIYDLKGVSLANMFNQTSVIEPLLEDRDSKGRTALHRASESGNLSQVIALSQRRTLAGTTFL